MHGQPHCNWWRACGMKLYTTLCVSFTGAHRIEQKEFYKRRSPWAWRRQRKRMRRPLSQSRPRSSCGRRCCHAGPPRRYFGSPSALSRSPPSCAPAPARPHHPPVRGGSFIAATMSEPSIHCCFTVAILTAAAGGHAGNSGSALVPAMQARHQVAIATAATIPRGRRNRTFPFCLLG